MTNLTTRRLLEEILSTHTQMKGWCVTMLSNRALTALLPLLLLLPMCSSNDDSSTSTSSPAGPSGSRQAKLRVFLTDKPIEALSGVWVTIASVRIHQSASTGEGEGGWVDVPLDTPMPINLLTLQNGILQELGQTALPAGHYQQVRLALTPNAGGGSAPNNYVEIATEPPSLLPIDVPSGTIKIVHQFTVADAQVSDLVLDFDASQSVRQRGNGVYFMQPVIKASSVAPTPTPAPAQ